MSVVPLIVPDTTQLPAVSVFTVQSLNCADGLLRTELMHTISVSIAALLNVYGSALTDDALRTNVSHFAIAVSLVSSASFTALFCIAFVEVLDSVPSISSAPAIRDSSSPVVWFTLYLLNCYHLLSFYFSVCVAVK